MSALCKLFAIALGLISTTTIFANENGFFTDNFGTGCAKNLSIDFNIVASTSTTHNHTNSLQKAIDKVSQCRGGGSLTVPAGSYYLKGLEMRTGVRLLVEEGSTFYPAPPHANNSNTLFDLGNNGKSGIKNVAIEGLGSGFTIDLSSSTPRQAAMYIGNVDNFKLANFRIKDNETIFTSLLLNISVTNRVVSWPRNGLIRNIRQTGSAIGYGLIQTYAAENVFIDNIYNEGGVALRIETDDLRMKTLAQGGVNNIFAQDIHCKNGMAAVMLAPHFMANGSISVQGARADNCAFAIRAEPGFVEIFGQPGDSREKVTKMVEDKIGKGSVLITYLRGEGTRYAAKIRPEYSEKVYQVYGLRPGTFANVKISDVLAKYGESSHYKTPQRRFISCNEQAKLCKHSPTRNIIHGPSIAAVYDRTPDSGFGSYTVETNKVTTVGFPYDNRDYIYSKSSRHSCPAIKDLPICSQ